MENIIDNSLEIFKTFITELLADNSRNYKIEVLKKWKNDDNVKYYLNYLYNTYITTGISDKKLFKQFSLSNGLCVLGCDYEKFNTFKDVLEYIKTHNTGSDMTILITLTYLTKHIAREYWELATKIITKNLILGIDALTINKCIPNLIPTFNLQLANKYFEKPEYVVGKEFALTTKIDGGRIIALKENGNITFYTRAGQPYEGLVDLTNEMQQFMPDNICLDGEITLLDKGDLNSGAQYKETMKITRKDGEKHNIKMLVFDYMPVQDFLNQKSTMIYKERRQFLNTIFNSSNHVFKYFNLLPILYQGRETAEITKWLNHNIEHGEEGVMINIVDATYQFKRTNSLLKVKKMQDIDLTIVGYEEGTNSNKGKLGAFIVKYKDNNLVKVGSGYTKELREEIWKHPQDYLNTTISIQYFEETKNADGGLSLRFPVFLDFRPDKNGEY